MTTAGFTEWKVRDKAEAPHPNINFNWRKTMNTNHHNRNHIRYSPAFNLFIQDYPGPYYLRSATPPPLPFTPYIYDDIVDAFDASISSSDDTTNVYDNIDHIVPFHLIAPTEPIFTNHPNPQVVYERMILLSLREAVKRGHIIETTPGHFHLNPRYSHANN